MALRLTRDRVPALYAIADADVLGGIARVPGAVATLARGGVEWIQIRAKHAADDELAAAVESARGELSPSAVLWMNDRADLAALYDLPGVHVGQEDLPPSFARDQLGPDAVVGFSTHSILQVEAALREPVNYVAVGPLFGTSTKDTGYDAVGLDLVREASRRAGAMPIVAIVTASVTRFPRVEGMASSTTMAAPASWRARASRSSFSAPVSLRP